MKKKKKWLKLYVMKKIKKIHYYKEQRIKLFENYKWTKCKTKLSVMCKIYKKICNCCK